MWLKRRLCWLDLTTAVCDWEPLKASLSCWPEEEPSGATSRTTSCPRSFCYESSLLRVRQAFYITVEAYSDEALLHTHCTTRSHGLHLNLIWKWLLRAHRGRSYQPRDRLSTEGGEPTVEEGGDPHIQPPFGSSFVCSHTAQHFESTTWTFSSDNFSFEAAASWSWIKTLWKFGVFTAIQLWILSEKMKNLCLF